VKRIWEIPDYAKHRVSAKVSCFTVIFYISIDKLYLVLKEDYYV
jgi:hypothetical protein